MRSFKSALFTLILFLPLLPAVGESTEPTPNFEDGNSIAEPVLADYFQANRAPGILSEPYDVVEADGSY